MKIGVLASQGAFAEHISALNQLGVEAVTVRLPGELAGLDGLVIPGGESTSISKLMLGDKIKDNLLDLINKGMPVFGTCAGMILLADDVSDGNQVKSLGVMHIKVKRNAFGRQVDSFETELSIPVLGEIPFPGVFIRAPLIESSNSGVEILARLDNGSGVAARQEKLLVSAFHPELTDDLRFHRYFLDIVEGEC
jgi:5'-phosphate synthase pdxT subunit